jgi:hypothetical protein
VKKLSVVFGIVMAIAGTASAQDKPITWGVKGGVSFNTVSGDDSESDTGNRTGFVVGLFFNAPANQRISFRPEFLFATGGAKFTDSSGSGETADLKLDFFEVPLLADIHLNHGSATPVSLLLGPSFGFRTRAEFEGGGQTEDIKDEVESMNYSFVTGVAVEASGLVIDGRYNWGLRNLDKSAGSGESSKTRSFVISLGYRFK